MFDGRAEYSVGDAGEGAGEVKLREAEGWWSEWVFRLVVCFELAARVVKSAELNGYLEVSLDESEIAGF